MSEVDRLVASLVASDTPVDREALLAEGARLQPEIAPLAGNESVVRAVDAMVGLGPLESLLGDARITDVLVNGHDDVWVERSGELVRVDVGFRNADDVLAMVRRVIAPLGLRIDRSEPAVDARLADGSRLHAAIPPASVDGPVVAIRRFHPTVRTLDDLIEGDCLTAEIAEQLRVAIDTRANLVVAGGTGAGKTTLLNVLCSMVKDGERIVTIEDAAELRVGGHVVRLESRRANVDGVGDVTMRQLVRHALRLRPDRIVVGEVRGAEALDMVQALATGHSGSMSTVHARSPDQALARIETLAAMAPEDVPHGALGALVRTAIDQVVMVERHPGGRRVSSVTPIAEVPRQ
ncbi:MAG: CpaF family protein [Acidimicrobiia bacterium]